MNNGLRPCPLIEKVKMPQVLSLKESEMLGKMAVNSRRTTIYAGEPALYMTPAEKRICKALVKKGFVENVMDTFYRVNAAGLERAASIY